MRMQAGEEESGGDSAQAAAEEREALQIRLALLESEHGISFIHF